MSKEDAQKTPGAHSAVKEAACYFLTEQEQTLAKKNGLECDSCEFMEGGQTVETEDLARSAGGGLQPYATWR